ncbi:MAG: type II toxin-antitoxin system RelE family toxin [Fusobacteriaceae bacterium]
MDWRLEWLEEAKNDLKYLDNSQLIQVRKAIKKVSQNPLPNSEGGYGKPLGNKSGTNLSGFLKIKLLRLGIRIVYRIVKEQGVMKIIVVSVREDGAVYEVAMDRVGKDN